MELLLDQKYLPMDHLCLHQALLLTVSLLAQESRQMGNQGQLQMELLLDQKYLPMDHLCLHQALLLTVSLLAQESRQMGNQGQLPNGGAAGSTSSGGVAGSTGGVAGNTAIGTSSGGAATMLPVLPESTIAPDSKPCIMSPHVVNALSQSFKMDNVTVGDVTNTFSSIIERLFLHCGAGN